MEEDGEKVDGLTAKLEVDFQNLGLTLYDAEGNLKSTYDILQDLSEIYPNLTTQQKAYYTELIAGKNRAQVAAAILNNFATAIDATETAFNSAGSAEEENAKQLDSIQGKLQAVRAEFERLASAGGLNDIIKGFLSLTANTLKLINAIGGLKTVMPTLITFFAIINANNIKNAGLALGSLIKSFLSLKTTLAGVSAGTQSFTTAILGSKTALVAFGGVVSLAVGVLSALITAISNHIKKQKEQRKEILLNADANNKTLKILAQNSEEYNKLSKQVNKTTEENEKLNTIEETLVSTLGSKAEVLNGLTKGTKEYKDAVEKLTKAEIDRLTVEAVKEKEASSKEMRSEVTPVWGSGYLGGKVRDRKNSATFNILGASGLLGANPTNQLNVLAKVAKAGYAFRKGETTEEAYGVAEYKAYEEALAKVNEKIREFTINGQEEIAQQIIKEKEYKRIEDRVSELKEAYENFRKTHLNELEIRASEGDMIIDTQREYDSLIKKIQETNEYTDLVKEDLIELAKERYPQFSGAVKEASKDLSNLDNQLEYTYEGYVKLASTTQEAWLDLKKASEEYSTQGYISAKTLAELNENYPKYLDLLLENKGNLTAVTTELKKNTDEYYKNAKAQLDNQYISQMASTNWQDLKQDIAGYTSALEKNTKLYEEYQKKLKLMKAFQNSLYQEDESGSSTDKWKEAFTSAYNDLKSKKERDFIDSKTYYKELEALNNKYFKGRKKYAEEYAKYEAELYKGIQEVHKEEIESLEHDIAMLEYQEASPDLVIAKYRKIQEKLHEQAEKYRKMNRDGNQDLIDELSEQWWQYEKKIEDYQEKAQKKVQDRFKDIRDLAKDSIDEEIDALEEALDKQNALLDEQIDRYKEEKETLEDQKEIQEKLLAIEEARKKLAEAKNKKVRIYREGRGFVYESDFDAVSEAQSELDSLLEEWDLFQEKAKIEDIIAQLEAEKKANEERVNKQIDDLNKLKDAWDKSLDVGEEINDYKDYLEKLGEIEGNSYENRLEALQDFVDAYKSEMSAIDKDFVSPTDREESSESYDSGNRGTGKNSYNVNTDYQKLIEEAEAAGAPEDHLAYLERKRNNKIEGEGLNYEKTYKYHSSESEKKSSNTSSSTKKKSSSSSSSGKSSIKSTISSVISGIGSAIKSLRGYASGTDNADGLLHFVGENGPELYVPPKGSGVISNPMTSNLMAWGEINPTKLVKELASNTQSTNIEVGNITLPNVKDGESFIEELKNFKGFAIQKQSVRK